MSTPDWLVDGAKIVVVRRWSGIEEAYVTKVKKVSTQSFSVENGTLPRFRNSNQYGTGGYSYGPTYQAYAFDSEEGKKALERRDLRRAEQTAERAYSTWSRSRTQANLMASIEAFNALYNIVMKEQQS